MRKEAHAKNPMTLEVITINKEIFSKIEKAYEAALIIQNTDDTTHIGDVVGLLGEVLDIS